MDFMHRPEDKNLHVFSEDNRRVWTELHRRSRCCLHYVLRDGLLWAEWLLELMPERNSRSAINILRSLDL